jgi:AAA ATPase domain
MDDISDIFVNRTEEINAFRNLIKDRRRRLLLIYGLEGRGKTCLRTQLSRISSEEHMVSAVVDFRRHKMLTDPDQVIPHLRERLGSDFATKMIQAEKEIPRQRPRGLAELNEMLSKAVSTNTRSAGSSVSLSGNENVNVGGDLFGGNKIIINNPTFSVSPDNGRKWDQAATTNFNNDIFRTALRNFLVEQKHVILFFDHFEDATTTVSCWVSEFLLDLVLEDTGGFSNLWIVVSGCKVPLQDKADDFQQVLCTQQIEFLPDEAVYEVWLDKFKGDKSTIDMFIKGAGGNTKILFLILKNYVANLPTE